MENTIAQKVVEAIQSLYQQNIESKLAQPQKTKKEFTGDLTVVVFPFLQASKKSPEKTAQEIGEYLLRNIEQIEDFNVVKGFLNLSISASYWVETFQKINENQQFGFSSNSGKTYMVEYSSPNTNKPLHLGHLRNNFLGYSVAEILKANGHEVFKTQIINDRGIHICKSMLAWQKFGNGETPQSSGLKGDHLVGKYYVEFDKAYKKEIETLVNAGKDKEIAEREAPIFLEAQAMLLKWEEGDKDVVELWKTMNGWVYEGFDVTYKTMGVDFDELYYESDTYILGKDVVEKGLEKGVFYQKPDGSIWCDLSAEKMDDKLLLRADGTSVYMTQDIGTAIERYKKHQNLSGLIYTVGNEQNHHFKVLFTILKKLGYTWADGCYHLSYGMIELPEGKMKSREGTVVDADDLMYSIVQDAKSTTQERGHIEGMSENDRENLYSTIGMGGLKYFLLKVDPKKGMVFDPKESIDLNGNTGPFIQYAYARIQSLLAKATQIGFKQEYKNVQLNEKEINLIKLLNDYPTVINEAGSAFSPAVLCNYIFALVQEFNNFYQTVDILREEDKNKLAFRLQLAENVGKVIKSSMGLLGINVPNKM
ncbi:MAG: arginine--tRNA ligase [Flavobacteriales bacterium]|nr:arginine--tRNA ligase [Flavobacteriales bacterium]MBX2959575.1 arginine--tRNA ligase [Flavobacteriales bacterium]